jgi:primosomal protein N' (replication factor Y)
MLVPPSQHHIAPRAFGESRAPFSVSDIMRACSMPPGARGGEAMYRCAMLQQLDPQPEAVLVAEVLVPVAVDQAYSYRVGDLALAPGDLVEVPLGPRATVGVVWAVGPAHRAKLKAVTARSDLPPLPATLRTFVDWVANWTLSPRGMVLRMCIRAPLSGEASAPRVGVRATGRPPTKLTPTRQRVMDAAVEVGLVGKSVLAAAAGCTVAVVNALVVDGALEAAVIPAEPVAGRADPEHAAPRLSQLQGEAAASLVAAVESRTFAVSLLEGVTGSGKTEVYFEAVAAALRAGRQALILLPEIALTAQFLDRFAARFGTRPAEWHSSVGAKRRNAVWHAVADGEVGVVAGARSALFLPFRDLALIVVDEEHEAAYKQEDGVTYHARDMAVVRGRIERAAVVLASATPSIETQVNTRQGRYTHLRLPNRFGDRAMPTIAAVDLKRDQPSRGHWIAPPLERAIRETVGKGEQALLFLNRRGYAPLTLCRSCGHRFQCPNCSAWLVEHRFRHALVCHHCGHQERRPEVCPMCQAAHALIPCGPGIERLAEEVAERFPDARTLVLSSDFPGGADRIRDELDAVTEGRCDIVIGTQLVAKGHNFPLLTLVGVIDADVGLSTGDPRAAERTFQMLQQVTGRAGRFERPGRAMLQTWQPEHPVIRALMSGDAERFYAEETRQRERAGLPPFGRLAAIVVSGPDFAGTQSHARALAQAAFRMPPSERWSLAAAGGLPGPEETVLLGPAEAPIAILAGRHRFRLLVRAPRRSDLQGFLRALAQAAPPPRGGIKVGFDVDPQSFL